MAANIPIGYYLSALLLYTIWGVLLYRGLRRQDSTVGRLLFRYQLIYLYLGISVLTNSLRFLLAHVLGRDSLAFMHFFYVSRYLVIIVAIAQIWQIYRIAGKQSSRDYGILLVLPLFILEESLRIPDSHYYNKFSNSLLCFETTLGILTYFRLWANHKFRLGANYNGILAGLLLPCLIAWLGHTLYLFAPGMPYSLFLYVMEPAGVLSWFLIARGMKEYDPPTWSEPPDSGTAGGGDLDEVRGIMNDAVGTLRRWV